MLAIMKPIISGEVQYMPWHSAVGMNTTLGWISLAESLTSVENLW